MRRVIQAELVVALLSGAAIATAVEPQPLPLGQADLGAREIVFSSSGDLWVVGREGGEARALTSGDGWDEFPLLSPDGATVAFTRDTGNGLDIHVVPLSGGEPRRLTWHPKGEIPRDWSPDGRRILFSTNREGDGLWRLYTIGIDEPWEEPLPLPRGSQASWSADGRRLAMTELGKNNGWLRYRGGAVPRIHVVDIASGDRRTLPHTDYADWQPMWIGDSIAFLSERDGVGNLYVAGARGEDVKPVTSFRQFGARAAASGPGGVVLVRHGGLWIHELEKGTTEQVAVTLPGRVLDHLVPGDAPVGDYVEDFTLSPDGSVTVVTARGDIFLVDAATGRSVNLTRSPAAHDRLAVLSSDGRRLAWFSDASGEYMLQVAELTGSGSSAALGQARSIPVGPAPTFYTELVWSPDARHLAVSDKHQRLWLVNVEPGTAEPVDRSQRPGEQLFAPVFSSDGNRLAWSRHLDDGLCAIFVRDVAGGAARRVSPDLLHCDMPAFSDDGRTLYMTSSALAPAALTFGMISLPYRSMVARQVLAVSVEAGGTASAQGMRVLRAEARNYAGLARGRNGALLAQYDVPPLDVIAGRTERKLVRLNTSGGPEILLAEGLGGWTVSADGGTVLVRNRRGLHLASADSAGPLRPVSLDSLTATIDRRAEWKQIYHEAWRTLREYFYDDAFHGQDIDALEKEYAARLPGLVHRRDLNDLIDEMFANISVSHMGVDGGDDTGGGSPGRMVGLPGANFERAGTRYRITKVLTGDNLSSLSTSPFAQGEVGARPGEWLLAVAGVPVYSTRNVYSYFEVTSPAPITVTLGPDSTGAGSRTVQVRLLPGENTLRRVDWGLANARLVDSLSSGRVGYIYLPDTSERGFQNFLRGFYGQMSREGLVIDERFNSGGAPADLMIEILSRKPLSAYTFRDGDDTSFPVAVFNGPKVMIANESAGSGGDTLPWMFRRAGLGPIVGTRTMGAGIGGFVNIPGLIDGGSLEIPNRGFYNPDGTWDIENGGVSPDIPVVITPNDWRKGHDPQLERAVREVMKAMEEKEARGKRVRPAGVAG